MSSIVPAHAAPAPEENLDPDRGAVVSVETAELDTVVERPQLPTRPPRTGDKNPGATMGQKLKSMAQTTNLSPESDAELQDVEAKEGLKRSGAAASAREAKRSPATPAPTPSATAGQGATDRAHPTPQAPATVGPAGSMSLMISANTWVPAGIPGMDVSGWQPTVNWSAEYAKGARFAYVKATEGIAYKSPSFADQYTGSANVGMIRGSYHFALPGVSTGAAQANYFVNNGGGWSADGRTLPGLLDIEYNPYPSLGNTCYNLSHAQMNSWIRSFSNQYKQRTGRLPAIYTTTDWWSTCTGNTAQFNDHPLHIASYYVSAPGAMPAGWSTYDIWQFSAEGPFSGDSNVYRGSWAQLKSMATSRSYSPLGGRKATAPRPSGYAVSGGIGAKYRATGGAARWGAPVTPERAAANGGRYQEFAKNGVKATAYWHPRTGAHMLRNTSSIGRKFIAAGRERGYGFPSTDERSIRGGAYQVFRTPAGKTTKVMWSSRTGSHAVKEYGAIGKAFKRGGFERGYGFPATDEYRWGAEVRQRFSSGKTIHWHSRYGWTWATPR